MPLRAAGKEIEIWFQDEARVGQQGSLTYVWAERGSRPRMTRDNRHQSAYIFGAVCPARGVGAAIVTPWVSSEAMSLHLREISTQVRTGAHAVLVCDGAGWHQPGGRLKVPDNISLLPLPPYSPELNPMENVWEYMRANLLSARIWDDYDAVVAACRQPGPTGPPLGNRNPVVFVHGFGLTGPLQWNGVMGTFRSRGYPANRPNAGRPDIPSCQARSHPSPMAGSSIQVVASLSWAQRQLVLPTAPHRRPQPRFGQSSAGQRAAMKLRRCLASNPSIIWTTCWRVRRPPAGPPMRRCC